jgi:hypothetical protein
MIRMSEPNQSKGLGDRDRDVLVAVYDSIDLSTSRCIGDKVTKTSRR